MTPLYIIAFCFLSVFQAGSPAKLNVFIAGKEVSRFLYDINSDLYLVKGGRVANMLRTPAFSALIPPIKPKVKNIKFKFNSNGKILYRMSFQSSNKSVMSHPKASIPLKGRVPRRTKGFRISFPCTGRASGVVLLNINITFREQKRRKMVWGPLQLSLRRQCHSSKYNPNRRSAKPTVTSSRGKLAEPNMCNKKCSRQHILQRFCFSDYVIRAKVDSVIRRKGARYLRVRITRTYKRGKVRINKRQLLEIRSSKVTCNCTLLKPKKIYLILGKEERHKRVLYVDDLTNALEWAKDGKKFVRIHRKKGRCIPRVSP